MKNRSILFAALMILLLCLYGQGSFAQGQRAKKAAPAKVVRLAGAQAWDCAACHRTQKVLPKNHLDIQEMPYVGCLVCHLSEEGFAGSLKGKMPGSHLHAFRNVQCAGCHGREKKPSAVAKSRCLDCHGSAAAVAGKTQNTKPNNPHDSPHYGTELDCNFCHHQHAGSEDYCAKCHKFNFAAP
ncbi:MAG: cytochrome c3 family protein [Smithellaceae bacterium]|nr:cytochrome c3 family protein [Smithellaceae bacterium]MDD3259591.1 cytochrome c3 family protein [Smithellaceae bacterium]MDD3848194.1 cytochrome c3 family protein [Smithellaceae bacterium]HPL09762.1 cytochrome c3 family protein [Smithellaceae bacterium]